MLGALKGLTVSFKIRGTGTCLTLCCCTLAKGRLSLAQSERERAPGVQSLGSDVRDIRLVLWGKRATSRQVVF